MRPRKVRPNKSCDIMLTRSQNIGGVDLSTDDRYPSTRVNLSRRNQRAKKKKDEKEKAKTKIF